MRINNLIFALSIFAGITVGNASPQFRLVSGERGVIFSVEDVSSEPTIDVELIDGDLSVVVSDYSLSDSTLSESVILNDGFWADSVVANVSSSKLELVFYNFSLPIEDMQKKFSDSRLILLLSQTTAKEFDTLLFQKTHSDDAVVTSAQVISRDGLEFLSLNGENLDEVDVQHNEGIYLLQFPNGVDLENTVTVPEEFLIKSVSSKVMGSGTASIEITIGEGEGYLSLLESTDSKIKIIFTDTRERNESSVEAFGDTQTFSYVLDEQLGITEDVVELVDEESVTEVAKPVETNSEETDAIEENIATVDDIEESFAEENEQSQIVYIVRDNVNIRSTPNSSSEENLIGQYPLGTKLVVKAKEGAWFNVLLSGNTTGWVYKTMVQDSGEITDSQWDAIYNSNASTEESALLDEFNSPGEDPLLGDASDVFTVDSSDNAVMNGENSLPEPEPEVDEDTVVIESYTKYGRDPFLPLNSSDFLKPALPAIDEITLVGITYSPQNGWAQFEESVDGDLVSFTMQAGEKVENGKILRIYEDKVVFLMWESDISYTVEKELTDEKE